MRDRMNKRNRNRLRGIAYTVLSTVAGCDHQRAKQRGYKDGWQMLLDKHDDSEMFFFCATLPKFMNGDECQELLDDLAIEYTQFTNWLDYVDACVEHPSWKPSEGPAP